YRGPYVAEAPDVVGVCAPHIGVIYESVRRDLRARSLFGPFSELGFTGSHHADGLYLFSGPDVRTLGAHQEYPIESIAPTSLQLLGVPIPRSMEGQVCTSVLRETFLRDHPVQVSDDEPAGAGAGEGWKSADDEARIAEHLRALGYVE